MSHANLNVCACCGRNDYDFVSFPCPGEGCGAAIVRCKPCSQRENKYVCRKCGFTGP